MLSLRWRHLKHILPRQRSSNPNSLLSPNSNLNGSLNSSTHRESNSIVSASVTSGPETSPDLKLPRTRSLVVILLSNVLLQISFFIIVSSSSAYASHLGGTQTFSGLVIGIPTFFSGLALVPLMKLDQGKYTRPMHFAFASMVLGCILYALAFKANFLYLILLGRIVQGFGFTFFMYSKRFCSDPRIVGVRRRTTLAGWLVVGQGCGMTLGPFLGGVLFKVVGFGPGVGAEVWNGYTSPGWVMAVVWILFWGLATLLFEDVEERPDSGSQHNTVGMARLDSVDTERPQPEISNGPQARNEVSDQDLSSEAALTLRTLTLRQWGVIVCMCWFAMTCFFILGAWESNLPIFGTSPQSPGFSLHWSPFAAGNFIALGGITTMPFLLLNLYFARRMQDRHILALGSGLGLSGLILAMGLLRAGGVGYGSLFACWFLVALGFNLASTCTLSLLSKQLPGAWNGRISMAIQYSNYTGRVMGAVWGGSGVKVGMLNYVGLEIGIIGLGALMFMTMWRELKAKTG